jgi:2-oxo-hept-3-ene-1,7-dioate hydratase
MPNPSTGRSSGRALDDAVVERLADELAEATRRRSTIERPSVRYPEMTVEDSYAVQRRWRSRREAEGRRIVGRKIGLTSKVMQDATGISEPDYGVIFDDQVFDSGATIPYQRYSNVRVEVELAFELSAPLTGPDCTRDNVLAATAAVIPALEVLDSHIQLQGRTIVDTISDNAALGAMVLGSPVEPNAIDLRWVGALLSRNGEIEESGVSGAVLGHPANGVAWLANKLAEHGDQIGTGEIVLAGSFTRPLWVQPGDRIDCDYRDLGVIRCQFN